MAKKRARTTRRLPAAQKGATLHKRYVWETVGGKLRKRLVGTY